MEQQCNGYKLGRPTGPNKNKVKKSTIIICCVAIVISIGSIMLNLNNDKFLSYILDKTPFIEVIDEGEVGNILQRKPLPPGKYHINPDTFELEVLPQKDE